MQSEGKINWKTISANLEVAFKMRQKIGHLWENISTIKSILECHFRGEYKISNMALLAFSGAIIYLINPIDLIPDTIPVVGFTDDAAIIIGALKQFGDVVAGFKKWKEHKERQTKEQLSKQPNAEMLSKEQKKVDLDSAKQQADDIYNQEEEKLTEQLLLQIRKLKDYYDQQLALAKQNVGYPLLDQTQPNCRDELLGQANTNKLLEKNLLESTKKYLTMEEDRDFWRSKCLKQAEKARQKQQALQALNRQMICQEQKMQKERLYFCLTIALIIVIVIVI